MHHPLTPSTALSRRRFLGATGAAGLGLWLASCGSDDKPSSAGSSGVLSLQLNWLKDISFGGDYMMVERGLATAAGFSSVDLIVGGPSIAADPVVASGKARFGYSAPELLSAARDGGAKLKTIAVGYQRSPFTLISLAETPLTEPGQLKGKTVAVDDINQITMTSFLKANSMSDTDMKIVPANFDPSLLSSKQVDAYLAYVPNEPISLQIQGVETVGMDFDDHGLPGVGQMYITTEDAIAQQPEGVTAALAAFVGGWTAFFSDLTAGIAVASKSFDSDAPADPTFLALAAAAYRDNYVVGDALTGGLLSISPAHQQAVVDALAIGGITTTAADLFDMTLLDKLFADHPQLKTVPAGS